MTTTKSGGARVEEVRCVRIGGVVPHSEIELSECSEPISGQLFIVASRSGIWLDRSAITALRDRLDLFLRTGRLHEGKEA